MSGQVLKRFSQYHSKHFVFAFLHVCVYIYENNYSVSYWEWSLLLQILLLESVNQQRYMQEAFLLLSSEGDTTTSNNMPARWFSS